MDIPILNVLLELYLPKDQVFFALFKESHKVTELSHHACYRVIIPVWHQLQVFLKLVEVKCSVVQISFGGIW